MKILCILNTFYINSNGKTRKYYIIIIKEINKKESDTHPDECTVPSEIMIVSLFSFFVVWHKYAVERNAT